MSSVDVTTALCFGTQGPSRIPQVRDLPLESQLHFRWRSETPELEEVTQMHPEADRK